MSRMDSVMSVLVSITLVFLLSPSSNAQKKSPPAPMPPAPAPAPAYANLTRLLSDAGPFQTFLGYCQSTKVIEIFQNQANQTAEGITLFVPSNSAFSSLKKNAFTKLSQDQLKQVMLYQAVPRFYSLSEFANLSSSGPVQTFGGSSDTLDFTDDKGVVGITSGSVKTKITSSVYTTPPMALYEVSNVLLPESIFGKDVPLAPAPAPAPKSSSRPAADAGAPSADAKGSSSSSTPGASPSSARRADACSILSQLALAVWGVVVLFL